MNLHATKLAFAMAGATAIALAVAGPVRAEEQVAYNVVDGTSIPKSLTGKPGDPAKGREVAINRRLGNCLACHHMPVPEQAFQGEIGPNLAGVADRYTEGELRLRVVNPKVLNEDTFMPAFYRSEDLHRVMKNFQGKTILTAEQVEDVVAYLLTLK